MTFLSQENYSLNNENCTAVNMTLCLAKEIPLNTNYKPCFDKWFSTLDLCLCLKDLDVLVVATIRTNRLAGESEEEFKKSGRSSFSLVF